MNIEQWYCWERLEYQFWKGRQAWASTHLENWPCGLWKYVFRMTGRLTFSYLHKLLEGQSSRLAFKTTMKTRCKQYLTVLKRSSSLGFKTSRKLVLGALKIRLQNDGSVNVFKSSYTSWRPVLKTSLKDVFKIHFWPLGCINRGAPLCKW